MSLTTFPEKDECPEIRFDRGGYKRSPKTVHQIEEELKTAKAAAQEAQEKAYKIAAELATSNKKKEDVIETNQPPSLPPEPKDKYLLQLKPGGTEKTDWSELAAITGTRPNVSKYSISRYSLDEWRKFREASLDGEVVTEANILDYNGQTAMKAAFGNVDKMQMENNNRLKQKARSLFRWKTEVQIACDAMANEVQLLEIERQRIKGASRVLMLPEAISKECLELRSNRAEPDLVADLSEQELLKEMALVNEVRQTLKTTLQKIEEQLTIDKQAKHRIEFDWCDKTLAYNADVMNISLNPNSNTLMFKPGATKFATNSAPMSYWEFFCRENIENVEAVRQASVDLRSTLNAILITNGRKLRDQADKTDMALAETVALTNELLTKLEEHLRRVLRCLADVERLILNLQDSIRKMDVAMKLAQTRLDNRNNWRPRGESVRDHPHLGLIEEVKIIHETVTSLRAQLTNAEITRKKMMEKRVELERDIAAKRKTLKIDRERCGMIRSHYPTASELAGF